MGRTGGRPKTPTCRKQYATNRRNVEGYFCGYRRKRQTAIHRILSGDDSGWEELFDELWPLAYRIAASIMPEYDGAAIEDAAQNTLVLLADNNCRNLRRYDSARGSFRQYVAQIARNATRDYLRRQKKFSRQIDHSTILETAAPPESMPLYDGADVTAALEVLTPRERQAIEMLVLDGCTTAEVAVRLGVTTDTVRSLKSHAMPKLKKYFQNCLFHPHSAASLRIAYGGSERKEHDD